MTKNDVSLLTLNKYCVIRSTLTERLYLDKDLRCYVFESEREAAQFCEQIEDTTFDKPDYLKQGPFIAICYGLGVKQIRVKTIKNENYTDISIDASDARRQYYNRAAMAAILRLKQTKKKKHLRELENVPFLAPIMIDERKAGQYPSIHYCYAELENGATYYLLFTTINDFDAWNETQGKRFVPNQTTLQDFTRVRKGHPVLINPLSDKLVLTDEQISEIKKKKEPTT